MSINPHLQSQLERVAERQRGWQLWYKLAACWGAASLLGLVLIGLQRQSGWASALALPLVALSAVVSAIVIALRHRRKVTSWRELARRIEAQHADLDGRLLTAVQQEPGPEGNFNYLQQRLLGEVLAHGARNNWSATVPQSRILLSKVAHGLALVLLGAVLFNLRATGGHKLLAKVPVTGISVTPGDATIEKGSSLVVLVRFTGRLPGTVELVVSQPPETARRLPLVKSLADPLFGGSLPEVVTNLSYHIEYAGQRTCDFAVKVFEYPRLEQADAQLTFPEYTRQGAQRIENTRRLSAVQGSRLDLELRLNKPVASARLVPRTKDRATIPLSVEPGRSTALLKQFSLEASTTYELQLLDAEGRTNRAPAQFVFEVLTNRAPEIRLASPRGDLKPSALEEIAFEGTVWDDFGVAAYGLGYSVAGQEPKFIELGTAVPAKEKRSFQYVLRLEDLGAQPDQLISWFAWADDTGPDSQVRRTTGDLFFGEVRPFEEVFREGQGQGREQGGESGESSGQQGGQTGRLAELQKQIISATWKLQRTYAPQSRPGSGTSSKPKSGPETRLRMPRSNPLAFPEAELDPGISRAREAFGVRRLPPLSAAGGPRVRRLHPALCSEHLSEAGPASAFGQLAPQDSPARAPRRRTRDSTPIRSPAQTPTYESDASVVREAQDQAITQAEAARSRQEDPRAAALWAAAIKDMDLALARLSAASNAPALLPEALAAEQKAYQALLKLQEHEYQVARARRQNRGQQGGGNQQMQRQLDELELSQSENRYETQRQAQAPPSAQRREELQIMNRLQELARRQQDLNERLKELQTALQEARTEQERQEAQRRLKRLQEEEQQMLADVDELRQRMDRPENQSRMTEQRRQLDQSRQDVQRAAEAANQGAASQALAAGSRAQRQLQDLRDQMRQENSSQFAEDMREMRAEARQLSQGQESLSQKLANESGDERKSLSESPERKEMLDQLARQTHQLTNLVERATQVSQQAETAEPLLSRQLYDTVRKFTQDSGRNLQETQDELLRRGLMTRSLLDRLREPAEPDGAKLMDITSEMLRLDVLQQATATQKRVRSGIDDLKRGVERAAEEVLGDDTEALRLAQQELNQLTDQLQREIAQAEGGGSATNQSASQAAQSESGRPTSEPARNARPQNQPSASSQENREGQGQTAQTSQSPEGAQGQNTQSSQAASNGQAQANQPERDPRNRPAQGAQTAQSGQDGRASRDGARQGGRLEGNRLSSASAGGAEGSDLSGSLGRNWDRLFDENAGRQAGPITGDDFTPWSDRLRDVEEMIEIPDLRNEVARARERARAVRLESRRERKKPDWAVVRLQVMKPLSEVRERIAEELARRQSSEAMVPIDRDPVPSRYSDLVRRYYEELGKDK